MDMAARHRAHPTTIQILDLKEIPANASKRPNLKQFHVSFRSVLLVQGW